MRISDWSSDVCSSDLPLPAQLKPLPTPARQTPVNPRRDVASANQAARIEPAKDGFINAMQVWPYSDGALYQVYASPGRVPDIALQPGEQLVSVSAGDTGRRSEERRVGKGCVSTVRYRGWPEH